MLQDKSAGYQDTWIFMHRRIDEGDFIQEFLSTSDEKTKTMRRALNSAFLTVNIFFGLTIAK